MCTPAAARRAFAAADRMDENAGDAVVGKLGLTETLVVIILVALISTAILAALTYFAELGSDDETSSHSMVTDAGELNYSF